VKKFSPQRHRRHQVKKRQGNWGFQGRERPPFGLKIVLELVGPEFAAVGRTDIPFEFEDDSPERAPERISET
jgi:hypothetical protein